MNKEEKDDYLIVVSTILAILVSKIADVVLASTDRYKFFDNGLDIWVGLLINIIILIGVALGVLKVVKFLAKKFIG